MSAGSLTSILSVKDGPVCGSCEETILGKFATCAYCDAHYHQYCVIAMADVVVFGKDNAVRCCSPDNSKSKTISNSSVKDTEVSTSAVGKKKFWSRLFKSSRERVTSQDQSGDIPKRYSELLEDLAKKGEAKRSDSETNNPVNLIKHQDKTESKATTLDSNETSPNTSESKRKKPSEISMSPSQVSNLMKKEESVQYIKTETIVKESSEEYLSIPNTSKSGNKESSQDTLRQSSLTDDLTNVKESVRSDKIAEESNGSNIIATAIITNQVLTPENKKPKSTPHQSSHLAKKLIRAKIETLEEESSEIEITHTTIRQGLLNSYEMKSGANPNTSESGTKESSHTTLSTQSSESTSTDKKETIESVNKTQSKTSNLSNKKNVKYKDLEESNDDSSIKYKFNAKKSKITSHEYEPVRDRYYTYDELLKSSNYKPVAMDTNLESKSGLIKNKSNAEMRQKQIPSEFQWKLLRKQPEMGKNKYHQYKDLPLPVEPSTSKLKQNKIMESQNNLQKMEPNDQDTEGKHKLKTVPKKPPLDLPPPIIESSISLNFDVNETEIKETNKDDRSKSEDEKMHETLLHFKLLTLAEKPSMYTRRVNTAEMDSKQSATVSFDLTGSEKYVQKESRTSFPKNILKESKYSMQPSQSTTGSNDLDNEPTIRSEEREIRSVKSKGVIISEDPLMASNRNSELTNKEDTLTYRSLSKTVMESNLESKSSLIKRKSGANLKKEPSHSESKWKLIRKMSEVRKNKYLQYDDLPLPIIPGSTETDDVNEKVIKREGSDESVRINEPSTSKRRLTFMEKDKPSSRRSSQSRESTDDSSLNWEMNDQSPKGKRKLKSADKRSQHDYFPPIIESDHSFNFTLSEKPNEIDKDESNNKIKEQVKENNAKEMNKNNKETGKTSQNNLRNKESSDSSIISELKDKNSKGKRKLKSADKMSQHDYFPPIIESDHSLSFKITETNDVTNKVNEDDQMKDIEKIKPLKNEDMNAVIIPTPARSKNISQESHSENDENEQETTSLRPSQDSHSEKDFERIKNVKSGRLSVNFIPKNPPLEAKIISPASHSKKEETDTDKNEQETTSLTPSQESHSEKEDKDTETKNVKTGRLSVLFIPESLPLKSKSNSRASYSTDTDKSEQETTSFTSSQSHSKQERRDSDTIKNVKSGRLSVHFIPDGLPLESEIISQVSQIEETDADKNEQEIIAFIPSQASHSKKEEKDMETIKTVENGRDTTTIIPVESKNNSQVSQSKKEVTDTDKNEQETIPTQSSDSKKEKKDIETIKTVKNGSGVTTIIPVLLENNSGASQSKKEEANTGKAKMDKNKQDKQASDSEKDTVKGGKDTAAESKNNSQPSHSKKEAVTEKAKINKNEQETTSPIPKIVPVKSKNNSQASNSKKEDIEKVQINKNELETTSYISKNLPDESKTNPPKKEKSDSEDMKADKLEEEDTSLTSKKPSTESKNKSQVSNLKKDDLEETLKISINLDDDVKDTVRISSSRPGKFRTDIDKKRENGVAKVSSEPSTSLRCSHGFPANNFNDLVGDDDHVAVIAMIMLYLLKILA